ncbi:ABC transporter ATP-binding protein [Candidatus Nomurabacteria bacterium]|nr:ABC transporter ATP-binding protein [Candidatus Nomurabacteria bacterium]
MFKVENVKKRFGGVQAIKGSNFEVPENKITALIGPNGAGKTTLFNIITGFIKPDEGDVYFRGQRITGKHPFEIANMGVSRTFQQVRLFKYLTIFDHLRMADDNQDTKLFKNLFARQKVDKEAYEKVLEQYGIERGLDALASELSYGQRKLLDLAMAQRKQHKILMLDEPVAGVNAVIQERIENYLLDLKQQGETILLIDHDMKFVRRLADYVIALDAGVVLVDGEPEKVLTDKRVLEAYLGE